MRRKKSTFPVSFIVLEFLELFQKTKKEKNPQYCRFIVATQVFLAAIVQWRNSERYPRIKGNNTSTYLTY